MPQTWPAPLQDKINEEGFSHGFGNTVVRTEMDIGPAKVRRRFTKAIDTFSCTIWVSVSEYSIFRNFYDVTLNGGVNTFNFNNPITGAVTEFRFTSPPSIRSLGGGTFEVSMAWESLEP